MKRREFITLVGGAAATWPLAARGQQTSRAARIGFLGVSTPSGVEARLQRLRAGLRDLGYVEGQNIFIDFRWAEGNYSRLVEFAPITTPKSNHITDFMTVPETLQVRGCRS
jgi:putative ABC transport system substrate-binding protein